MSIVSCPRCADPVVMPVGASPSATVRCPLCQEEFPLAELLDAMPPALIVVEDPEAVDDSPAAADSSAGEGLFFADAAGDRAVNLLEEVEADSRPSAISIEPTSGSAAPAAATKAGGRRRGTPRPQRKKKNPAMEVVKVVLGGIAGLVIAQAILWWLPWSKYRRDPFDLGPKVSSFAGWMVPPQFHGKGAAPAEAGDTAPTSNNSDASPPSTDDEGFGAAGTGFAPPDFIDPNEADGDGQQATPGAGASSRKGKPRKRPGGVAEEPNGGDPADVGEPVMADETADETQVAGVSVDPFGEMDLDADLLNMIDPSSDPILEEPTLEEPVLEDPLLEAPAPDEPGMIGLGAAGPDTAPDSPAFQIAGAPEVSDAELREAVDEADRVVQAWATAENPSDQRLIAQSYQTLANLAEAVTFSAAMSIDQTQKVSDLLSSLTSGPAQLSGLKMVGPRWLSFRGREGAGILLVGKVVGSEQEGDIYVTRLQVAADKEPIAIYRDTNPADACPPGESIVVLGAIINAPEDRVLGYAGDAATLIWMGQCLILN